VGISDVEVANGFMVTVICKLLAMRVKAYYAR
jgi:hypothetical protein